MPRGRSRCGFFVSSAAVATMSKPMKAKKTRAAPVKMPATPKVAGCDAEVAASSEGVAVAPFAAGEPDGGMNGE